MDAVIVWRGGTRGQGPCRALVRWTGFDPRTGEAWADSWVLRKDLTPDLQELAPRKRKRNAAALPPAPAARLRSARKSARLEEAPRPAPY